MDDLTSFQTTMLPHQQTNGDEAATFGSSIRYIGNFHKTLPHNVFGEVDCAAYESLIAAAPDVPSGPGDFELVPLGDLGDPAEAPLNRHPVGGPDIKTAAAFVNPLAGFAAERIGPRVGQLTMPPPPKVLGDSTAAEMTELYWMARLRDVSLDVLETDADAAVAVADLKAAFGKALAGPNEDGKLTLGLDLPSNGGTLALDPHSLFRCGLVGEDKGPLVSQFFLHDVPFGTFTVVQKQFPYAPGRDYLTQHRHWLLAQNGGYDCNGRDYTHDNDIRDGSPGFEANGTVQRRIGSLRDLARFVNKDALHEAYFNATLLLLDWNAPIDTGNPYTAGVYKRQGGFGTLGGPQILAMVSEVATRALQVVWRQKWRAHRRLRPEAYGGLMQMQMIGFDNGSGVEMRPYGLPNWVFDTEAAKRVVADNGTYFLPMAFSSGSPAHPSYGAGHAAVAGACVTVLKAWFDEAAPIASLIHAGRHPQTRAPLQVVQPANTLDDLPAYDGADLCDMTVGGELNKIACNVAMGRSMGGVHWRSDNTRSLRLGEQVGTILLARHLIDCAETPISMSYTNFNGYTVTVSKAGIHVDGDAALQAIYNAIIL